MNPPASRQRRAAVLGSPIAHSLSPALHRAGYAALGLHGWSYDALQVGQDGLGRVLDALDPSWVGLSLTMPLKQVVLPRLARISPLAEQVGAVNTVLVGDDLRLAGENTDVYGLEQAVRESGRLPDGAAHVFGAGATACSAVAALARLGFDECWVHARDHTRAAPLRAAAERVGIGVRPVGFATTDLSDAVRAGLVISTVPAAGADALVGGLPEGPITATLLDVSYHPWPTPLAMVWARGGGQVVGGFEMLLHQAAEQFRLMTGRPAPVAAMRAAGEAELARRVASAPSGGSGRFADQGSGEPHR